MQTASFPRLISAYFESQLHSSPIRIWRFIHFPQKLNAVAKKLIFSNNLRWIKRPCMYKPHKLHACMIIWLTEKVHFVQKWRLAGMAMAQRIYNVKSRADVRVDKMQKYALMELVWFDCRNGREIAHSNHRIRWAIDLFDISLLCVWHVAESRLEFKFKNYVIYRTKHAYCTTGFRCRLFNCVCYSPLNDTETMKNNNM